MWGGLGQPQILLLCLWGGAISHCLPVAGKDVAMSHMELSDSGQGAGGHRRGAQPSPSHRKTVLFFRVKAALSKGSFWTQGNGSTVPDGSALSLGNPRALMICL